MLAYSETERIQVYHGLADLGKGGLTLHRDESTPSTRLYFALNGARRSTLRTRCGLSLCQLHLPVKHEAWSHRAIEVETVATDRHRINGCRAPACHPFIRLRIRCLALSRPMRSDPHA